VVSLSTDSHFSKILIANRGEIAMRIIRSAKSLGYSTVAIYSQADADLPHVASADYAICVGSAVAKDSYLSIPKVIEAAVRAGAQAVHPGYGFLSESAEFASACKEVGLVFVGPSPEAIRSMADKSTAKQLMHDHGVPCIPGYDGSTQSDSVMKQEADRIGFPVMIKAVAGGGGKGMRLVPSSSDMEGALRGARSEAEKSFGDGRLMLEKAVMNARHIEVQIFGDQYGNCVYLGDRDCSLQRRHQKILEEAPAPGLSATLRQRLGEAAVKAAKAVAYQGAGTVEFLVTPEGNFYFLEMNTRLQVEHPVTELITGQDLVAWQLNVAAGMPLPLTQDQISINGHAIEVRVYAEDPASGFLPQSGVLTIWHPPTGHGVRVDHGLCEGANISTHYDPMIAKVIAHGSDREAARRRLCRAVENFAIGGIRTNLLFLLQCLNSAEFMKAGFDTEFLDRQTWNHEMTLKPCRELMAVAAAFYYDRLHLLVGAEFQGWHSRGQVEQVIALESQGCDVSLTVLRSASREREFKVHDDLGSHEIRIVSIEPVPRIEIDGIQQTIHLAWAGEELHLVCQGGYFSFRPKVSTRFDKEAAEGTATLKSPMSGLVAKVNVALGDRVVAGQILVILEAMKMELELSSPISGFVTQLEATAEMQVGMGETLVRVNVDNEQ
jgi:geranyl-CoA carboxylase alpha subunit|tara:strand:+ start:133266 stop:135257 length:1992 start_codon:yes stop_codon:yes gene_type:complete